MSKVYISRDDQGKIVGVASTPCPDMNPPLTTEMDTEDIEIKEYIKEQKKLTGMDIMFAP